MMQLRAVLAPCAIALALVGAGSAPAQPTDQPCQSAPQSYQCQTFLRDSAFLTAQSEALSNTADAMARVGARAVAQTDDMALAARDVEAAKNTRDELEADLAILTARRVPDEEHSRVSLRLQELDAAFEEAHARFRRAFPAYFEMVAPSPLAVAEVQNLLAEDEALLFYARPAGATFVWALTRETASWTRLPVSGTSLAAQIGEFRASLDPTGGSQRRPVDGKSRTGGESPFNTALGRKLYDQLIAPIGSDALRRKRLVIVASGPLASLPFAALPMADPPSAETGVERLRSTKWLGIEHALTFLPAVTSLRALRCASRTIEGECAPRRPLVRKFDFVGIGAPRLAGADAPSCVRGLQMKENVVEQAGLECLSPLAGADQELTSLSALFGAERSMILRGASATEAVVRQLDLERVSVIAFATHGLLPQEAQTFVGGAEGGLVLTPPSLQSPSRGASIEDDGLLSVSEAATLKLNADWVILSACNTAQAGKMGDDALSGLARAFFFAGARSLLVSHWSVGDDSAQRLIVETLRLDRMSGDRAESLRLAMKAMLNDRSSPAFAHPSAWAPFVLVGETRR